MSAKDIKYNRPAVDWVEDVRTTVHCSADVGRYVINKEVWQGLSAYRWLGRGLILAGIVLGLYTLTHLGGEAASSSEAAASQQSLFSLDGLAEYYNGSAKYVILILMEVVIFHFTRRTLMAITGEYIDTTFNTFIAAEKRMIKVAFYSFIMESIWRLGGNIAFGILDVEAWFKMPYKYLLESFYLGFAVIDNYNELKDMSIKQSHRYTIYHMPVALIIGGMLFLILKIPFAGAVLGPIVCSVLATLTMHTLTLKSGDISWVYVDKKSRKKRKKKIAKP